MRVSMSAVNLRRSLLLRCWHRAGRNYWAISVLGTVLRSEFLFKSLTWDTYANELCCTALLSMVCASRCTGALPSTGGGWGFAAVERGKHHLHAAMWCTPFLLRPSLLQSLSSISLAWSSGASSSPPSPVHLLPWHQRRGETSYFPDLLTVAPGEHWGWVLRCHLGKRLSWLNGELRLITVVT